MEHYFALLGGIRTGVSREGLADLVTAQMARVPFENISKLYYLKRYGLRGIPTLQQYVEGIERYHFGGTCYSNNYYFGELLRYLGYDVRLCGADMANPDVHMVNIVTIDGREFLVDVGYGEPFTEPMPRDMKDDYVISYGHDRYLLKPQDAGGRSKLELYREGVLTHGYVVNPIPRTLSHFSAVVADSFRPQATFMNALLVARFGPSGGKVLSNLTLVSKDDKVVRIEKLPDRSEIPATIEIHFGIPAEIVTEAIDQLGTLAAPWD